MLQARLQARLDQKKAALDALRPLPAVAVQRLQDELIIEWIYNSKVNFVGRAVERSLTLYIEACTPRTQPLPADEQWIPLQEASAGTTYSQEYLSLLARTGRLEAVKKGKTWYTTRRALRAYQDSIN